MNKKQCFTIRTYISSAQYERMDLPPDRFRSKQIEPSL